MFLLHFDGLILAVSFSSFFLFMVGHILALRMTPVNQTARVMVGAIALGFLINISAFIFIALAGFSKAGIRIPQLIFGAGISSVLYALLVFNYVGWIFGMGIAAIRIRLLLLLMNTPAHRATREQILTQCNAGDILRIRLARLVGSGHLILDGDSYRFHSKVLTVQAWITAGLSALLGIPLKR